ESIVDSERHNLRASFLAGILHGLGRKVLLIQHGESPVAADYREEIEIVRNPDQIVEIIEDFARQSILATQTISRSSKSLKRKGIAKLTLGASAAENEFRRLEDYFLETAEFNQTIRGDGKIVAGRKGSGKTAIFFRARDIFRNDSRNIVIDLKPESHELIKLRELLSEYKNLGIVSHTFTGFWQVIFLHEILLKVKSDLEYKSRRDHTALGEIIEIDKTIGDIISSPRGDFTERLNYFVNSMLHKLESSAKEYGGKIPPEKITNFVYDNNMRLMYDLSKKHLKKYNCAVLFFDNIDKGWPATGIHQNDILIVRCLIDAANKIQREYAHADIDFRFSVFLRNDVYELLVENTSDRGKDAQIKIDWSDPEKLKLLIGRRLSDALNTDDSVKQIWDTYFPKSVEGEDGFDYAIRHSLMRPRFLIDILERSISIAVNRGKQVVEIEDLREAILQHSRYLVNDFGYEIRDVSGITYEILDAFLGSRKILSADEVRNRLSSYVEPEIIDDAIKHLVWYGFLGFMKDGNEKYIYDYNYIMRRMHSEINRAGSKTDYVINPAFYIGLQ
ncbi:P-loop ATPase, Sll1717 family, partial [Hyphococcus sp.]|uniref:P-loop ATPase, Sll1717 family n=1 Tax=Hyphococcus sp. TaxID=2038636 RepID=UPI0035C76552